MTLALLGPLVLLALIDATSFGTLLIPVWFLITPGRIRATRVLVFLGTIAAFYWVLGLLLSAWAVTFLDDLSGWLDTETGQHITVKVDATVTATQLTATATVTADGTTLLDRTWRA